MRRLSRPSPLGVFASATVVLALTAAAPVTASTSARPSDRSRAIALYGGQLKHIKPPVRCRVPPVRNKPLAVAVLAIVKRHCSLGRIGHAFSKVVKRDHVISEMPSPGTVLPNQGKVNLVISRGRRP